MIGVNAIVLPGATIGESVVGVDSVVTKDIPSNSIAVEYPARVLGHIRTERYGRIVARIRNDATTVCSTSNEAFMQP
jgi:acetyltransferase-like isoleucine patch superfamily enzyme